MGAFANSLFCLNIQLCPCALMQPFQKSFTSELMNVRNIQYHFFIVRAVRDFWLATQMKSENSVISEL